MEKISVSNNPETKPSIDNEKFPYIKIAMASAAFLAIASGIIYLTDKTDQNVEKPTDLEKFEQTR